MFSVILYGRNDSHGYNLHKRAAISFNALAEVMSDPDDEILFVDYNTPDDHPTFPEAIHDTLTDKAKKVMRVLRVRPDQHVHLRSKTHLVALEAQSRNVALRRSNPRNRWILYTNTDMLLVPRNESESLSDILGGLARRLLPGAAIRDSRDAVGGGVRPARSGGQPRQAARLGGPLPSQPGRPQLHADEVRRAGRLPGGVARGHVRHPRLRRGHDPGLALRFEPGGAAGALSRPGRHADRQGVRLSLRPHPRRRRQQQGPRHADERPGPFIWNVASPYVPAQAETWGWPDTEIEEIRLDRDTAYQRFTAGLDKAIEPATAPFARPASNGSCSTISTYDLPHTLPFVCDQVVTFPRSTAIMMLAATRADFVTGLPRPGRAWASPARSSFREECEGLPADLAGVESGAVRRAALDGRHVHLRVRPGHPDRRPSRCARAARSAPTDKKRLKVVERLFKRAAATEAETRPAGRRVARRFIGVNVIYNKFWHDLHRLCRREHQSLLQPGPGRPAAPGRLAEGQGIAVPRPPRPVSWACSHHRPAS